MVPCSLVLKYQLKKWNHRQLQVMRVIHSIGLFPIQYLKKERAQNLRNLEFFFTIKEVIWEGTKQVDQESSKGYKETWNRLLGIVGETWCFIN